MPPKTVPAVDGTTAGGDQQCPAAVLLDQARGAAGVEVTDGVDRVVCRLILGGKRQHLLQQRVVDVAVPHPRQETLGDHHRKQALGLPSRIQVLEIEPQPPE